MAILPSMQSVHYDYNPALSQDLDAFSGRLPLRRGWPDAVFVSRRALPRGSYRHLSNAAALERTAEALGLSIVHPQHMNWYDQVSLFANCRLLAGEFGSGLHNAIFSPAGTRVVTLNWIVDVQSRIANFRQQQVGYILPSDGQPRGYSIEPTMTEVPYEIDVDEFAARLEPLVSDLQRASDRPRRRKRLFPW
jgi:O-antigen biosynthesis protein WbqL